MNLLIVEDENLLAKQLMNLVALVEPAALVVARTNSIKTTVQWLQEHPAPDLILTDVELADGQCFGIFNQVVVKTPVIFTTAYDEYALQAFKVNSIDYLLKPIKEEELRAALTKYKEWRGAPGEAATNVEAFIRQLQASGSTGYKDRFLVKSGQKMLSVNTTSIAYFCARNTLNYLVTKEGQKYTVDYTLDELESLVDPKHFFRANRQYLLAHESIRGIHLWFNGKLKLDLTFKVDEDVVISRGKAPVFKAWTGG